MSGCVGRRGVAILMLFVTSVLAEEKNADELAVDAVSHPDDVEVSLWAGSDQLANPVAFTFDHLGRMYICETFRQQKGVEDNRGHMDWLDDDLAAQTVEDRLAYFRKHLKADIAAYEAEEDRITVLADEDGDGKADRDWVFADGFNDALTGTGAGVLVIDDAVYYTCIPDLWKLSDRDGDGLVDEQTSLHYGYGVRVAFRGHDSHGLVLGPDGRLYFSIGDRGYNIRTEDGTHLKDPESGAVFRCELDGSRLEVFATGLRNPQELVFDDAGNLFTGDNNSDSGDKARWVHLVEGSETGWRMAFQYLPDRGPWNREKLWHPRHEGQPAYIIPPIVNFADGPSGLTYYPGTGLGNAYRGTFFLCDFRGDAAMSGIRSFKMRPKGASFEMSEARKFLWNVLATDVDFGPDGGLYTTDWIAGWDGLNRGRVMRVTNAAAMESGIVKNVQSFLRRDLSDAKVGLLLAKLGHADRRVRMKAQMELARRAPIVRLGRIAADTGKKRFARLHAIWTLGQIARTTDQSAKRSRAATAISAAAQANDPWLRAAAVASLGDIGSQEFRDALVTSLADDDPRVQAKAAIALGRIGDPTSVDPLVDLLAENDNQDVVVRHGAVMGLAGSARPEMLAALANDERNSVRLGAVLALRRLRSELVASFLADADAFIMLEAARAIHDLPVESAMQQLADVIERPSGDEALMRRVLNANYRFGTRLHADRIGSVIVAEEVTEVIKLEAIDMLANWATPSNRDRVLGMWRPLPSRDDAVAKQAVATLISNADAIMELSSSILVELANVAAEYGIVEIAEVMQRLVNDQQVDGRARASLLEGLVSIDPDRGGEVVMSALEDESSIVRSRARELLVAMDLSQGLDQLEKAIRSPTLVEQQAAVRVLARLTDQRSRDLVRFLAKQLVENKIPLGAQLDVVQAVEARQLHEEMRAFLNRLDAQPYGRDHLAVAGGDVQEGARIFFEKVALSCVRCHSVAEVGGRVGPNLAGVGKEKDVNYLLEAIVDPNKKIAEGFGTLQIITEDGLQFQGIVQQETADLIHLIDADEKRFYVVKDEIVEKQSGKSAMPEDLRKQMTTLELRDLLAYLASLKTPWEETLKHEE